MKKMFILKRGPACAFFILYFLLSSCTKLSDTQGDGLPRSTPEAEGVSSKGIRNFLNAAASSTTEFHSFMMLRHGKVIAEGWWYPYGPDLRHTLYSTSKSFTSTAVGLAADEGLLSVEDQVISFFPEDVPDTISPFLRHMKIRDLLTMSAGQDPDPTHMVTAKDTNWVRAFLALPVVYEPGSRFLYNSLATYMLSAIVQKVTGEKIIDYLTPRLFEPLGIEGMDWEVDPAGINTGGWGLRLKTADMAKFGQLYLQKGEWKGIQILPEAWIQEATTAQIEQYPGVPQAAKDSSDWLQGYGYQFWRCRNNAFRADGADGQFIVVMPDKDAVIVFTAESPDMQSELNLVWEYLLPAMQDNRIPADREEKESLDARLASLSLPLPDGLPEPELAKELMARKYILDSNQLGIESLEVNFRDGTFEVTLGQNGELYPISFAKGSWAIQETAKPGPNRMNNAQAHFAVLPTTLLAGSYAWMNQRTVELVLRYIESPHYEVYTCIFSDDGLILNIRSSLATGSGKVSIKGRLVD